MKKTNLLLSSALTISMLTTLNMNFVQAIDKVYPIGVTIEENTTDEYTDSDYTATFVYEDTDERDAVNVTVSGNLQFYSLEDEVIKDFIKTGDAAGAKIYDVYEYQDGMFNTGYGLNGDTVNYDLKETEDERFEITLPLPGNLYYYDYTVTYADGSTVTMQDPANPSPKNNANDHDAGHSIVYVGNSTNTTKGQEEIYARTDGKTGTYSYTTYIANDGSGQPLGIYLPYGYDENKTYKTIYVSHGGGGNEAEWMTIGALPNIMDNLIAEEEVSECIVVTMDNAYYASTDGVSDRGGRTWDFDAITANLKDKIIPYVEANYSVSKDVKDRAMCGLSMGSLTTSTILQSNTEMFGYYGCFSGANVNAEVADKSLLKDIVIYLTAGNVDMALKSGNNDESRTTVGLSQKLDDLDVNYTFETQNGAHDWGMWRNSLTMFVKDYLWDEEDTNKSIYSAGVTIEENTTDEYTDSDYTATFVYEDTDERDAVNVTVSGNLQFYSLEDEVVKDFIKTGDAAGAKIYDVYEYQDGMFNTGYGLNGDTVNYDLKETEDERFEITLPLPGNLYYYDYTVTYADGSTVTMQDPANPSPKNNANDHDAGHSIVYVGNSANTTKGQEEIYARTDGKIGMYSFVSYEATDGTMQPLGIYLPYGYDENKTYKTIYVSHGGGGNEAEWMTIGALPNIMDNLIAEEEVSECIVVTMDNTYFEWNYDTIAKNLKENVIPYIETNYSVSKDVKDRAMCGLSMGSMTTSTMLQSYTKMFGYYGCFSGANTQVNIKDVEKLKNVVIYLTAGNVDMALKATTDEGDVGNPGKTVGIARILDELGVEYGYDVKNGAHDWGVWRDAYTTFVKDYLWNVEKTNDSVTQNPTDDSQETTNSNHKVKTGDETQYGIYVLGIIFGFTGLTYILKKRNIIDKKR